MAKLWEEVKPLYQQLHAYVKNKLLQTYSDHRDKFPSTGQIPAHLLGEYTCMFFVFLPPATKLGQGYVLTHVCDSVHRGGSATPPPDRHLPGQVPPLGMHLPSGRHPPGQTPLGRHHPSPGQTPHPCAVHAGIWSTSGRYASYWNAILLINCLGLIYTNTKIFLI